MSRLIATVFVLAFPGCAPAALRAPLLKGVTVVTSPNLATWLPTTSPDADELKPCEPKEDLVLHCSWKGEGGPRFIYVEIHSTNYPGVATNWGKLKLADMTIEGSRNSAWTILGPDIPEYAGIQSANIEGRKGVTARTKVAVASGQVVELRISSYDNGGSAKAEIWAENCDPAVL